MSRLVEHADLLENLSLLLDAGVGVERAFETLAKETDRKSDKEKLTQAQKDIDSGKSVSSTLESIKLFPNHINSLIAAGERSGNLAKNMRIASVEMQREAKFRGKLRSVLTYPAIVINLAVVVAIGVAWFILPLLSETFAGLGNDLPAITKLLLNFGQFMQKFGLYVVVGLVIISIGFALLLYRSQSARNKVIVIMARFPGAGELYQQVELARFGYSAGSLLEAGISVVEVFRSIGNTTNHPRYARAYSLLSDRLEQGWSFQRTFEEESSVIDRAFPNTVQQLVVASEKSGHLPEVLDSIGARYESGIDDAIQRFSSLLEPIMLVVVALMVAALAIAVILPIYQLVGSLNP